MSQASIGTARTSLDGAIHAFKGFSVTVTAIQLGKDSAVLLTLIRKVVINDTMLVEHRKALVFRERTRSRVTHHVIVCIVEENA
jgi:3'-phosphoadenosine 5'-phosphosulfate sulfotransferase (PAPS reductase)/FAD synthetase